MANEFAIHSVGESIVTMLDRAYPANLRAKHPCDFRLVSTHELATDGEPAVTTLSLMLYRVTMDEHLRNIPRRGRSPESTPPLALDLHYMLTVWADKAEPEQVIAAWAMRQLHEYPVLERSSLSADADWTNEDHVHIIPAELTNEDIMRIWDALPATYRLSMSYIARVVRIDLDDGPDARRVVSSRFRIGNKVEEITP